MNLTAARKMATRAAALVAGAAIIYHEVVISESAEPLLIFLGLWLCGIPPAMFLDGLRRITSAANASVDEVASRVNDAVAQATAVEEPHRRSDDPPSPSAVHPDREGGE